MGTDLTCSNKFVEQCSLCQAQVQLVLLAFTYFYHRPFPHSSTHIGTGRMSSYMSVQLQMCCAKPLALSLILEIGTMCEGGLNFI